ncbi:MAG: KH domain-containing protein, partial [Clostridiaceae bacterium]|nr:KH domain-containing protein [Clostridiaceae bacterium]
IQEAQKEGKPVILIINKVDGAPKENILPLIKAYDDLLKLDAYLPLSALTGDGIDRLLEEMARLLPIRRPLFDLDDETDQTERMLASELIRREVILQTDQEIPYGVSVLIERFEEIDPYEEERELAIDAVILCQRQAHKQILIGRGGDKIKSIGTAARRSIGQLLGARVHLSLFIKVRPDWQDKVQDLQAAGILGGD